MAAAFIRRHSGAIMLLALGAALRLAAYLAYPGPFEYPDSAEYLGLARHPLPGLLRPSGYPFFLFATRSFQHFTELLFLQGLIGLGAAAALYAVCMRYRLPRFAGCLAMTFGRPITGMTSGSGPRSGSPII